MDLELNSVWKFGDVDGFTSGLWRILDIIPDGNSMIIIEIINKRVVRRPQLILIDAFHKMLIDQQILKSSFPLPLHQLKNDQDLSKSELSIRKRRFKLLSEAIKDKHLLIDVASKPYSKLIKKYADRANTSHQNLYRLLYSYWKFGQQMNALLPAYSNCGSPDKRRKAGVIKRGAPARRKTTAYPARKGVNVYVKDQELFLRALKKWYLKENPLSLTKTHIKMTETYYKDKLVNAELTRSLPDVPTYEQFCYWKHILLKDIDIAKKQTSKKDWELNHRSLLGTAAQDTPLPGSCFEIDATIGDIHMVTEHNRNRTIGKPAVYIIADKASSMIVGLYVGLENESWSTAQQAILNALLDKKEYCQRYGVDITPNEWPCHHLPQALLCDRGGLHFEKPEQALVPIMSVEVPPTNRADLKGVVERAFKSLNDSALHQLDGTTLGKPLKRRDRNPQLDAKYTLKQVTKIIIKTVLEHNNRRSLDRLANDPLLIREDLAATPLNFWNCYIRERRHALRTIDEIEARAILLPKIYVTVTPRGLKFMNIFYTCELAESEGWFSKARSDNTWKIEGRVDADNFSRLYIKPDKRSSFIECTILSSSKIFINQPLAEVFYLQDSKKYRSQKNEFHLESAYTSEQIDELSKEADNAQKLAPKNKYIKDKVRNIRENRKTELLSIKQEEQQEPADSQIRQVKKKNSPRKKVDSSILEIINQIVDEVEEQ